MSAASHRSRILAVASLAFTGGLSGGVVFPILPVLGLQLGIAPAMIGLILSLNRITRLAVNPLSGILVDRYGARWPLAGGLLVEGLATLCFDAGVHSVHPATWFLFGRGLWGLGSSLLMVGALTAALILSRDSDRGLTTAKIRMSLSFGMPAGLVMGGLIADRYSPAAAFLTAAAIAFLGMAAAIAVAPYRSASPSATQPASGVWPSLRGLLRTGPLWMVWLLNFCVFFSVQGVVLASLVLILEDRHLYVHAWGAEGSAGLLMAMMVGSSAVASWIIGSGIDRRRRKAPPLLAGTALLTGGFILLATAQTTVTTAAALTVIGIGLGGINIPLLVIMGEWVPAAGYGRAVSIYQVLGDLGGSLGPIIGLEAIHRFGSTDTLLAVAGFLAISLPLAGAVWWREQSSANNRAR